MRTKEEKLASILVCMCSAFKYDMQENLKEFKKNPNDLLEGGKHMVYSSFYKYIKVEAGILDIPLEELSMDEFNEEDFY